MISLPGEESRMTPVALRTAWCGEGAEPRPALPQPPAAHLWPRAVGPLGRLQALPGGGTRPFERGRPRASRPFCPRLPARPRRCRLLTTPQAGPRACVAAPTGRGGLDPCGSARLPPLRAGRRPPPLGRQGRAQHRGLGGGPLCLVLHPWGWSVGWAGAPAQGAAPTCPGRLRQGAGRRLVWRDPGGQAAAGAPAHLPRWQRGAGADRRLVEMVRALRTRVCPLQKGRHRGWAALQARLACTMAAFPVLVQGHGFQPSASGVVPLSMAAFRVSNTKIVAWLVRD